MRPSDYSNTFGSIVLECFSLHVGTVIPMLEAVMSLIPVDKLAVHFHDTYGQSLSNILVALQVSKLLRSRVEILGSALARHVGWQVLSLAYRPE